MTFDARAPSAGWKRIRTQLLFEMNVGWIMRMGKSRTFFIDTKHWAVFFLISFGMIWGIARESAHADVAIATFTTSVADQDAKVKTNIARACRTLDGAVIAPEAVFSFSDTVGEASVQNGYVRGRVLYRDEIVYETGGGLCQVSTTLYNAFLIAGFAIVERHRHFQPVSYAPLGLDATIKYGKKDLRMRNTTGQRVRISATMNDRSLVIALSAPAPITFRYEIDTEEEELEIPLGQDDRRIRKGISVLVYRKKFLGSRQMESFLLYRDYFPPVYLRR